MTIDEFRALIITALQISSERELFEPRGDRRVADLLVKLEREMTELSSNDPSLQRLWATWFDASSHSIERALRLCALDATLVRQLMRFHVSRCSNVSATEFLTALGGVIEDATARSTEN